MSFGEALEVVRASSLYTVHTPVPAGHDYFDEGLFGKYMGGYPQRMGISWRISMALCWLEFRVNTESTSSHGIGPMGTQEYVMGTISWRTMQEPNRTLLSAPG